MLKKLLQTEQDITPVILRLTAALVLWPHGAQKVLGWFGGHGFAGTMAYFAAQGIPYMIGLMVVFLEFFGALLLLVGLGTRFLAASMTVLFLGMIFKAHLSSGFFMNWVGAQQGEGFEYHLLYIGISLALLVSGGGRWSMDHELTKSK